MKKANVYNHSKCRIEKGTWKLCPRCKGFGAKTGDDDNCHLCRGYGNLWISESGWTRAKYSRLEDSKLC